MRILIFNSAVTGCLVSRRRGSIEFVPATGDSNTTCSRSVFVPLQPASVVLLSRPFIISAPRVLLAGLPTISQVKIRTTLLSTGWRELMFSPCACLLSYERSMSINTFCVKSFCILSLSPSYRCVPLGVCPCCLCPISRKFKLFIWVT